jgi:hypothetical protein
LITAAFIAPGMRHQLGWHAVFVLACAANAAAGLAYAVGASDQPLPGL